MNPYTFRRRRITSRYLTLEDIPNLLSLEIRQWEVNQAADEEAIRGRITAYPDLCVGAFCDQTGEALSSMFMRPIEQEAIGHIRNWQDGAAVLPAFAPSSTQSLFGIGATSVDPDAVRSMESFFWPHVRRLGWREAYLGSPARLSDRRRACGTSNPVSRPTSYLVASYQNQSVFRRNLHCSNNSSGIHAGSLFPRKAAPFGTYVDDSRSTRWVDQH